MGETAVDGTAIEWTHVPGFKGETWNPTTGCDRVSPGCAHCYALVMAKRLKAMGQPAYQRDGDPRTSGPGFGFSMHDARLIEPLRWRKPRAVFVNSMSDLFHEDVTDDFLHRVFATMGLAPAHIFMVLTKRPERALEFLQDRRWRQFDHSPQMGGKPCFPILQGQHREGDIPLPNVWIGTSIENARYTWRADVLREIPAAVRFISAEPLLGSLINVDGIPCRCSSRPVDDMKLCDPFAGGCGGVKTLSLDGIDWVIAGGESGPGARPFHLEHAREIIEACRYFGVDTSQSGFGAPTPRSADSLALPYPAVFVKQLGAKPMMEMGPTLGAKKLDMPLKLADRKGGDMSEWPADLRIREFPRSAVPA